MGAGDHPTSLHGLAPSDLRPEEVVLHSWSAPGGRGVLTNLRCLLLGRPRPVRRKLQWSQELERVSSLNVERIKGVLSGRLMMRGSFGGGTISPGTVDATYGVMVDQIPVYIGPPDDCADLQKRIGDARTSRCVAVFGRVLPYHQPAPSSPRDAR